MEAYHLLYLLNSSTMPEFQKISSLSSSREDETKLGEIKNETGSFPRRVQSMASESIVWCASLVPMAEMCS